MPFLAAIVASFLQGVDFLFQEVFLNLSQFYSIVAASSDILNAVNHHHFFGLVILIKRRGTFKDIYDLYRPEFSRKS